MTLGPTSVACALARKSSGTPLFFELSPNKTWEGFIGGGICTFFWGWIFAGLLGSSQYMTCPPVVTFVPAAPLTCEFQPQMFVWRPLKEAALIAAKDFAPEAVLDDVLRLVNAMPFPDGVYARVCQFHAMALACFAAAIAPFGGFLASSIKRAYNIADFNTIIPGHGGVMDRIDCQLLMMLCTSIHLRAFVWAPSEPSAAVVAAFRLLNPGQQSQAMQQMQTVLMPEVGG